jgi:hypothetical protein
LATEYHTVILKSGGRFGEILARFWGESGVKKAALRGCFWRRKEGALGALFQGHEVAKLF